jgi:hypothetical protein
MPSRKQRRRRQKERRHEYEYVYVDDEGNEVEVDSEEAGPAPARTTPTKTDGRARGGRRPVRVIQPPSWRRVGKRALIFAPFMYIALSVIATDLGPFARAVQTVVLLAFFLPFSYVMDSVMYKSYLKRGGKPPPDAPSERRRGRHAA